VLFHQKSCLVLISWNIILIIAVLFDRFQVIIRDIVSKSVVAQFRAHSSPLSALSFDPSGTLLVTASVYGHNLNVFRLTPPSSIAGGNGTGGDTNTTFVHLYKLSRGVTNAVSVLQRSPFLDHWFQRVVSDLMCFCLITVIATGNPGHQFQR
jgi:WD40 repeat protein